MLITIRSILNREGIEKLSVSNATLVLDDRGALEPDKEVGTLCSLGEGTAQINYRLRLDSALSVFTYK